MLTQKQEMILAELRKNSRQHISSISKNLGMPLTTVHDNLRHVKKCIKRNTCLIDFPKLGYSLRINFIFRIPSEGILTGFLANHKNVNSVYRINSRRTITAECLFRSIKEAYEFKEALQDNGVKNVQMRYIIDEIKKEGFP